jgi:hypothetical protein
MADRVALAVVSRPRTGRCGERGVCARDGRPRFLILIVPLLGVVAYFSVGCNRRLPGRSRTRQRHRISAGASVKSVQRMLGHASATLTLDRYGHLFPDEPDDVARRMDGAARQARVYRTCTEANPTILDNEGQETKNGC